MIPIIHYVLVVMLVSNGGYSHGNPAIAMTDFDSKQLCENAAQQIRKAGQFEETSVTVLCIQKTL